MSALVQATAPEWTTACIDWQQRIVDRQSLIVTPPLFQESADAALRIFQALKLCDVPGEPRIGDPGVSKQWIFDFVAAIFGAYNPDTGVRLINEFFLLISKKNSKSTYSAGIMLTALVLNWRRDAEFYIIAPTKHVANNSFNPARAMIHADPQLRQLFQVQEHNRTITHRGTNAKLQIIAAESDTVSGVKGTGVLIEEVWLFGKRANAVNMFTEVTGGMVSRADGFTIYLSTHSDEAPRGVFADLLSRARAVRDGKITQKYFLPVLYEFPPSMLASKAYMNPANFYITNPNLGASVGVDQLLQLYDKAKTGKPEEERQFWAKHLNVPISIALANDTWLAASFWEKTTIPQMHGLDELLDACEAVTIGVDGGGLDDLLAIAVIGRRKGAPRQWLVWAYAWASPIVLERRKSIASTLADFAASGELTIVPNVGADIEEVADMVKYIYDRGLLIEIGLDSAGVGQIIDAILARGVPQDLLKAVTQGWRLKNAIQTVERKLAEGTLQHGDNAMMAWSMSNARTELRSNSLLITKQASGWAKIDPVMAMLDAVHILTENPNAEPRNDKSVYETRGVRYISYE
ncbi:terminase large subunit [Snodgrassella communis]|jgi:phage terminase large subunit-like protein|uniref:terminase large subunit n=1 Tax=Snodgrassella communis TaxID=2946699 RepID=UPI000C1EB014|nr:terminase TerL endonuclease subunit [Snodgrassella communis]PIT06826.1 terminase [Snodgrassella communis]